MVMDTAILCCAATWLDSFHVALFTSLPTRSISSFQLMLAVRGLGGQLLETPIEGTTVRDLLWAVKDKLNQDKKKTERVSRFQLRLVVQSPEDSRSGVLIPGDSRNTVQIRENLNRYLTDVLGHMLTQYNSEVTLVTSCFVLQHEDLSDNSDRLTLAQFTDACREGQLEDVEALLHRLDPSCDTVKRAFHGAISLRRLKIARLLLEAQVNVNSTIREAHGPSTALNKACRRLQPELAQALLENRADVNQANQGKSPLHVSLKLPHLKLHFKDDGQHRLIVDRGLSDRLVEEGILRLRSTKFRGRDHNGWSGVGDGLRCPGFPFDQEYNELHRIASESIDRHLEVARLLLSSRADVNAVDPDGETALISVMRQGQDRFRHASVVEFLLENRADVNQANGKGKSPLHVWLEQELPYVQKVFKFGQDMLKVGQDLVESNQFRFQVAYPRYHSHDYDREADLHVHYFRFDQDLYDELHRIASESSDRRLQVAKLLLSSRADVNAVAPDGETALTSVMRQGPARIGQARLFRFLQENGADLNFQVDEETPAKRPRLAEPSREDSVAYSDCCD
ncbi:ANK1 [Symbiodinium sp. KB8]|nr:ANK1 [Symbiodinium sp. KB8]